MIWLLDIGNSFCKYTTYTGQLGTIYYVSTNQLLDKFKQLFLQQGYQHQTFFISNVASTHIEQSLNAFSDDSITMHFARVDTAIAGVRTDYDKTQLGIDRFVCLVASWHQLKRSCIVLDCGTVSTIDYLDNDGVHRGGVIFPALKTIKVGLSSVESIRPTIQDIHDDISQLINMDTVYATCTKDAIVQGSIYMLVGAIKEVIQRMRQVDDIYAPIVMTGRNAQLLSQYLQEDVQLFDNLVLQGLAILFDLEKT